jgi:hypothetical protein
MSGLNGVEATLVPGALAKDNSCSVPNLTFIFLSPSLNFVVGLYKLLSDIYKGRNTIIKYGKAHHNKG